MSESVKRALVTGVSTGIGEATVRRLRELSWDVIAVTCREKRLAVLAAETRREYVVADLSDETAIGTLAARVLEGGSVDALVNNAGDALGVDMIAHADPDRRTAMYHRNVMTALRTTRALLSGIRERGDDLVFLTSTATHDAYLGGGDYVVAKRAERTIANILRQELVGEPICTTEIAFGIVEIPELSLNYLGSEEAAAKVYEGVTEPLPTDDVVDATCQALTHPAYVNIDSMIL